ncbi:MAG: DUF5695 domain-containing protein, partial [Armatimonadota bacterium]|nr:DUF5695 domain-containing protein [Armatimonadota bacterium]
MTIRLMALCLGALFALGVPLAAAPTDNNALLVDLDARDPSAGTATWQNRGTLGAFEAVGHPAIATIGGVRAVSFDGLQDAYRGPVTPPALEGAAPRTIEVWAYNPTLDSDEETLVSWGKRGGPDPNMLAFGWGRSTDFGAAAHWSADLGWNGVPTAKHWHYLVYTYDGTTVCIYDDGVEKNTGRFALRTATGLPILIGVQMAPSGLIQFKNEYTGKQQAGSLAIAAVRIRAGALTAPEIVKNFDTEAGRYGASRADAEGLLSKGLDKFNVGPFTLTLLRATQTAVSLSPRGAAFDFLPGDRVAGRLGDGNYHLGDVTLKTRVVGGVWKYFSSARTRDGLAPGQAAGTLAVCDLTPSLGADCPVKVTRQWVSDHGKLSLRFRVANRTAQTVELGAFGAAMVFNNLLTGRSLEDTHEKCSFATPYVGGPAGYVQVTRLNGQGPALVVFPESGTSIEAYRPLTDDPTTRGVTFEGFYEAMTHSKAYAENEWKNAAGTWNLPTSRLLKPGETATYGYQFALAPSIKQIEPTLIAQKRPVVVGVPGYVLPNDLT